MLSAPHRWPRAALSLLLAGLVCAPRAQAAPLASIEVDVDAQCRWSTGPSTAGEGLWPITLPLPCPPDQVPEGQAGLCRQLVLPRDRTPPQPEVGRPEITLDAEVLDADPAGAPGWHLQVAEACGVRFHDNCSVEARVQTRIVDVQSDDPAEAIRVIEGAFVSPWLIAEGGTLDLRPGPARRYTFTLMAVDEALNRASTGCVIEVPAR